MTVVSEPFLFALEIDARQICFSIKQDSRYIVLLVSGRGESCLILQECLDDEQQELLPLVYAA